MVPQLIFTRHLTLGPPWIRITRTLQISYPLLGLALVNFANLPTNTRIIRKYVPHTKGVKNA
jgi:hypothetical protein